VLAGHLDMVQRFEESDTTGYPNVMSILGSGFIRPFEESPMPMMSELRELLITVTHAVP
jgi:hypothetical protein